MASTVKSIYLKIHNLLIPQFLILIQFKASQTYTLFCSYFYNRINQRMKKLISIIKIEQVSESFSLQNQFKVERNNLKRYHQTIKNFKTRLEQNKKKMKEAYSCMDTLYSSQSKSIKKYSQLDYYMLNGTKVFGTIFQLFYRAEQFYHNLHSKCSKLQEKISEKLNEQKKKFKKNSQNQQNNIREYTEECYPDTTSLFFRLGFMEKVNKKPDPFRQGILIDKSKMYSTFLTICLSQMQKLKFQSKQLGQEYYEGGKFYWLENLQKTLLHIDSFEINEGEIDKIVQETSGIANNSNCSVDKEQQIQE